MSGKEEGIFCSHSVQSFLFCLYGNIKTRKDVPKEVKERPRFQASSSMSALNYSVITKG